MVIQQRSRAGMQGGFTLIELMVGLAVGLAVLGGVMTLAFSSKQLYEVDRGRITLQEAVRGARDLITMEIRQSGERIGDDIPALVIVDGSAGAPDTLVVRRGLIRTVLPVCEDHGASFPSDEKIEVAVATSPPSGCEAIPDTDSDGNPDNMQEWMDFRVAAGGTVSAFIYNPTTGNGEFFDYQDEHGNHLHILAATTHTWAFDYPIADQCRIYLLEETELSLQGDLLRAVTNLDTANAENLMNRIQNFQAVAHFQDGSQQTSFGAGDLWKQLQSIEIELVAFTEVRNRTVTETQSFEVLPRNVISR